MIVMSDVWDESQYRKHVFIMSLLLLGLSSGESQSSRQMVINFHNSFHGRMGAAEGQGHFLTSFPKPSTQHQWAGRPKGTVPLR